MLEAIFVAALITLVAALIARSLFVSQPPPQIIYVQTEPVTQGGNGCLTILIGGAILFIILLAISGA